MTDGITLMEVKWPELAISRRFEPPPVPETWRHAFAGVKELFALAAGSRLSVVLEGVEKSVVSQKMEWGSSESFTAVAVLPRSRRLVVGRGDGRIEVRDARTLEISAVFRPLMKDATCLCALDEDLIAVSDGDRTTTLLSLSGSSERLDYEDVVIGLHRLADGRLAVVCPRRILVYVGRKRERDADLAALLPGVDAFSRSALSGETLLLASQTRGLLKISVNDLPLVPAPDASVARATELLAQLERALTAGSDFRNTISALIELDDKKVHRETFDALKRHGAVLDSEDLRLHLSSKSASVRREALGHMNRFADHFSRMAVDVKPLLGDVDGDIRLRAVGVLGTLKDPAAVEWLLPLRTETDRFFTEEVERVLKTLNADAR